MRGGPESCDNDSQDLCSGSIMAGRKRPNAKHPSLRSPVHCFSTYSSGFSIDFNREKAGGGRRETQGARARVKQRGKEEEERGMVGGDGGEAREKEMRS